MAVDALEYVVSKEPTYKNSLMYLGRAYYRKGRFQDAHGILQRALALNQEDEIAWLAFGLTQLRVGQVDKGLESLKGGITLASRVMVDGYHNFIYWDTRGLIRASIRRSAFLLTRGAEEKDSIIQATDRLLAQIDEEENFQRNTARQNARRHDMILLKNPVHPSTMLGRTGNHIEGIEDSVHAELACPEQVEGSKHRGWFFRPI